MTKLLVSVRSAAEAAGALEGGADLIDVKEPSRGSLGAADPRVWSEVMAVAGPKCPLSTALGELRFDAVHALVPHLSGFQFAKIGLAYCADHHRWSQQWAAAIRQFPRGVAPVAVVYADAPLAQTPAPDVILDRAIEVGCRAMLLDTFRKSAGGLFDSMAVSEIARLMERARQHGFLLVIGGSIDAASLPMALSLRPDYVAVRGAVCRGTREGNLDPLLVRRLANRLDQHATPLE